MKLRQLAAPLLCRLHAGQRNNIQQATGPCCRRLYLDAILTVVDAKHVTQHLDDEKPEGIENEVWCDPDKSKSPSTSLAEQPTAALHICERAADGVVRTMPEDGLRPACCAVSTKTATDRLCLCMSCTSTCIYAHTCRS
jgi:hypothetical protein